MFIQKRILFITLLLTMSSIVSAAEKSCAIEKVAHCGGFLEGISVDSSGGVWVMDVVGDRVLYIGEDQQCVERTKTGGMPNGSKFRSDGKLVIAGSNGLLLLDPTTLKLTVLLDTFEGKPLGGLNDLSIDSSGGIYFTVPGRSNALSADGRVFYLPANSTEPTLMADNIAFPNGIALSPDEQAVAVAEFTAKRILSLPSATAKSDLPLLTYTYAYTQGGIGPDGILFDKNSQLLAANLGATELLVYSKSARLLPSIKLPKEAGMLVTNMTIADQYLYITEGEKGDVWRMPYPQENCN